MPRPSLAVNFAANLQKRFVPVFVILALFAPTVILIFPKAVKARAAKPAAAAPISAPPELFTFPAAQNSSPVIGSVSSSLALAASSVLAFFAKARERSVEAAPAPMPQPGGIVDFDFDGDNKADIGRWRPGVSEFEIEKSGGGANLAYDLGSSTSQIAPGDFNGDGNVDAAVFDSGTWRYKTSTGGSEQTISLGTSGDVPMPGDYDGDGTTDAAVFRPSNNTWHIRQSSTTNTVTTAFGATGDIPVPGNYDGDTKADIAVFRPSTGYWHILGSTSGYFALQWGLSTDVPAPGHFDEDSKTDPTIYRPSTGTWYVLKSDSVYSQWTTQVWGNYGDQPAPADYDGDGKTDYAVWRPTTGVWHIKKSTSGYNYQALGFAGDKAVPSAFLKQVGGTVNADEVSKARIKPKNATGGTDLYSQNFSWGMSLVGLPGRSGLDMGFGMSYNSLVWTKAGSEMHFDTNADNISPGFRFGFPTIEPAFYNSTTAKWSYLMVTPSGGRVEFRQTAVSNTYETADSSYAQLVTEGADNPNDPVENIKITITGTDGTQMSYEWKAGAFRCGEIKDRNGNFITVDTDETGVLRTVTDTLGRVVTVNYDSELFPTSITQVWKDANGSGANVTHAWATFAYATKEITTSFAAGITVVGPPNGTVLKVLEKVTYPDSSHTKFYHNSYGQVWKIENIAADSATHVLNRVSTNLETPSANQTDCPRFTATYSFVENFNGGADVTINNSAPASGSYSLPGGLTGNADVIDVWMTNHPDNLRAKTYVGQSGWKEGLTLAAEDCLTTSSTCTERKRWTWTDWSVLRSRTGNSGRTGGW
ncbi:MAG: FG-GAP repeat domain-containing protein [Blastocatellia bacterium]